MIPIPDPKTMIAIKNLPLAAKTLVDGFLSGLNNSRLLGAGATFSQYRNYLPGDDLRQLDWKLVGRTERYYIKQAETEKHITVHFVVDASLSMNHDCTGYSKLQYAGYLTAALALLAHRQGDNVGLSVFNGTNITQLPPRNHPLQMQRIYHTLGNMEAAGRMDEPKKYGQLFHPTSKQLVVFITDFYQHQDELTTLMAQMNARGQETVLLHLLAPNELNGKPGNYDALTDLETGETMLLDKAATATGSVMEEYLAAARRKLLRNGVYYCLVDAGQTPGTALSAFLNRRNKMPQ
ncbi:MAG TPA: DUF58 domain-containing protein [Parapedobacter sp.]|nr:DUF58 domain-containing protein [Parapedobacter sp.]